MSDSELTVAKKKLKLLEALTDSNGLVQTACKNAEVARASYYNWMNSDKEFAESAREVDDFFLDQAEAVLHDKLKTDTACLLFYLKCRGKKRGYIEKQEIEHSTGDIASLRRALNDSVVESEY